MPYKTIDQFKNAEEYSRYVCDTISVGVSVRCIENCGDVRKGDTGRVTKVSLQFNLYSITIIIL